MYLTIIQGLVLFEHISPDMNETRNTSHKEQYLLYCLCRDVDPEPPLVHAVELGGQAALGREGEVLPE